MYKLSVIVPIFKVAPFIERCVRSLFEQTLQEVEYLFVDDASPDRSIEILHRTLTDYPNRQQQVRILTHEVNKGLPAARNTGLAVATGEYIFHCDSDDFVEPNLLEALYEKAKAVDADVVWCDFWLSFEQNERYMKVREYATPAEALRGMLVGAMKYNVWNKLVRRSLYTEQAIRFPDGHSMGEDMTMIRLMACAERVAYVPEALYHYVRLNMSALTQTFSECHLVDIRHNVDETVAFLRAKLGADVEPQIALFQLSVKLPFLFSGKRADFQRWQRWYPEANRCILQARELPLRTRLLQWMAAKEQFWAVWLYHRVVYKFLYGVIYK
ncbi:MAG: glycosyltransferase family 2 protein [Rikenellaceae bacterium]|nr:glycosyltransferase family 2 protein [Rikenellaceae bacterium]